jgi:hypothetical protein
VNLRPYLCKWHPGLNETVIDLGIDLPKAILKTASSTLHRSARTKLYWIYKSRIQHFTNASFTTVQIINNFFIKVYNFD